MEGNANISVAIKSGPTVSHLSRYVTVLTSKSKPIFLFYLLQVVLIAYMTITRCFLASPKRTEDYDARLQVIMKFVGASNSNDFQSGRKSSLTDIIDAVTRKVKGDPSLAQTLTQAINATLSDLEKDQRLVTRRGIAPDFQSND